MLWTSNVVQMWAMNKLNVKAGVKLLFKHIYNFLKANGLLKTNKSGFTHGDSTINQLINICNKIHCQLDNYDEIPAVFLDLSKAFDKVWHKGLLYKLKKMEYVVNSLNGLNHTCPTGISVVINGIKSNIIAKTNKHLFIMKAFKYRISRQALITYYFGFIQPIVEYGDLPFDSCTKALSYMIEEIKLEAAQTATGAKRRSSHAVLYFELGWILLYDRRKMHKMCKLYTILYHLTPKYLSDTLQSYQTQHRYSTLTAANPVQLKYPIANKEPYRKSFSISCIQS